MKIRGFTLMELLTVMLIIGILAGLAVPRYRITVEKQISAEGVNILMHLRGAQERWRTEQGTYTDNFNDLDITIPAPDNFNDPELTTNCTHANLCGVWVRLACIERPNLYTLDICSNGMITCTPDNAGDPICTKIGH